MSTTKHYKIKVVISIFYDSEKIIKCYTRQSYGDVIFNVHTNAADFYKIKAIISHTGIYRWFFVVSDVTQSHNIAAGNNYYHCNLVSMEQGSP